MGASILTLLGVLLPTFLKFIEMWINKKIEDKTKREKALSSFLNFINSIEPELTSSANMRKSAQEQKERLNQQIETLLAEK